MKTKKFIAVTLCMILLFGFIPHITPGADTVQPLDFCQEEKFD